MKNEAAIRHFEPVRVTLPSEEVARRLADAVRTGFFRIGSRLPSERSLAEQMQVSRPTVREAVKLLVEANILTVRPGAGGGTFVTSEIVPLGFIAVSPEMRPGEIDEALEVRRLILPWVTQIASQYAEDDDYDLMREAIAFGLGSLPKPSAKTITPDHVHSTIIATMRFDLAIARATRNSLIVRLMDLLLHWVEPLRYKTLHTRADLALAIELVERMMQAIENGDPARITEITEQRLIILETALEEQTGRRLRRRRPATV
ncbi:FadR/GntR family transcriptional regulator [Microvirga antarctica]|uniref:FadR/GntR family transcriptional regulator n=1 Tax=Microvirga antarctica TaxID=2819233 RepID=UPI001B30FFD7|nr:GntR family transcriptional regulator [Microvirga antarctica]